MDIHTLEKYYKDKLLIKQTHPKLPLTIWNYSVITQYEGSWDEITMACRGLVTDDMGKIVARPFRKFFNMEEGKHKATKDFKIYNKEDGSLIIAFKYQGEWVISSRGSFMSDQAIAAKELFFKNKYNEIFDNDEYTFLFEYCSKSNRIVLNYNTDRLILLGIIKTEDGSELDVQNLDNNLFNLEKGSLDVVKEYDGIADFIELKKMIQKDQEGFVILFSNGDRMKIKGEEYLKLHKIMTQVSTTSVWENLMSGGSIDKLLGELPDEFYHLVKDYENELETKYWEVAQKAQDFFKENYQEGISDKEFANKIANLKNPYKSLVFAQYRLNFNNYSNLIFDYIKPKFCKL